MAHTFSSARCFSSSFWVLLFFPAASLFCSVYRRLAAIFAIFFFYFHFAYDAYQFMASSSRAYRIGMATNP